MTTANALQGCALDASVNIPEISLMFHTKIPRRKSRRIMVGNVAVGGDAPISVQTMTNTNQQEKPYPSRQQAEPGYFSILVLRDVRKRPKIVF